MSWLREANIDDGGRWEGNRRVVEGNNWERAMGKYGGVCFVLFSRRLHGNRGSSSGVSGIGQAWNPSRKGPKTKEKVSIFSM